MSDEETMKIRMNHTKQLADLASDIEVLQEKVTKLETGMKNLAIISRHVAVFEEMVKEHFDDRAIKRHEERLKFQEEKVKFEYETKRNTKFARNIAYVSVLLTIIGLILSHL